MLRYTNNKRDNRMGYEFIRDIHIEYQFYQRMAGILKGKKSNRTKEGKEIYEVECPCCKKKKVLPLRRRSRT